MKRTYFLLALLFTFFFSSVYAQNEREPLLFEDGKTHMDKGDYLDAIKSFERYYALNEKISKASVKTKVDHACFYLGELHIYMVDKDNSDRWFARLISRSNGVNSNYLYVRDLYGAIWALAYKKYDDAVKLASQALHNNPKSADALLFRGRAYKHRDEAQKATNDFTQIVKMKGDHPAKAFSFLEQGQGKEAIEAMEKLLKNKPLKQYYLNMASIYASANLKVLTLQYIEKAMMAGFKAPFYYFVTSDFETLRNDPDYLALLKKYGVDKTPAMKQADELREQSTFELAFSFESARYCDQFLREFPQSEKVPQILKFKEELTDWEKTKNDPSRQNLEDYIKKYPQGNFVAKANEILSGSNKADNAKRKNKQYCFEIKQDTDAFEAGSTINLVVDNDGVYGTTSYYSNEKSTGANNGSTGVFWGINHKGHLFTFELFGHAGSESEWNSNHYYLVHDQVLKVVQSPFRVDNYSVCADTTLKNRPIDVDVEGLKQQIERALDSDQIPQFYDFSSHVNIHEFMDDLRTALLLKDRNTVANMVNYPFVDAMGQGHNIETLSCNSAYEFVQYRYDLIFKPELIDGVLSGHYYPVDGDYNFRSNAKEIRMEDRTIVVRKINGVYKIIGTRFYS